MTKPQNVTIRDVAREAGVSVTAVSMALNDKGTLSKATRERVKRIAAELNYQADALARGLRSARSGAIGLVMRPLDALGQYSPSGVDFFTRFAGAAATAAMDLSLSLMLVPDPTRSPVPPLTFSLDGYIVVTPLLDDPVTELFEQRGIPFVTEGRRDDDNWVSPDDRDATLRMLDHLRDNGASRIVLLRGTDRNRWNLDCEQAYRDWTANRGLPPRVYGMAESEGIEGGRRIAAEIVGDGVPDAVFCLTGRHAFGLLEGLTARGYRVPDDILLAAASDSEHARLSKPAITAVDLLPERLARKAVELIVARIEGRDGPAERLVRPDLLIRASSTRPAGPAAS